MKPGQSIQIDITETDNGYFVSVSYSNRGNDRKVFTEAPQLHDFVRNVMNLNFPPRQDPQPENPLPVAPDPHQSLG